MIAAIALAGHRPRWRARLFVTIQIPLWLTTVFLQASALDHGALGACAMDKMTVALEQSPINAHSVVSCSALRNDR